MTASIEREVKLAVPADFTLPSLTGAADGHPVSVLAPQHLHATYYDTADLRLLRWGITVRHRLEDDAGKWTVKFPSGDDALALVRSEHDVPGDAETMPARVAALVRAFSRNEPMTPIARLDTVRTRVELRDGSGATLVEVADDAVAINGASHFREVEVEAKAPDVGSLVAAVVRRLRKAGARTGDQEPKLVKAVGPVGEREVPVVRIGKKARAGDVVHAAIAASVARLMVHDPGVRTDAGPEAVHQARVATRRLRSDLRTFRPLVDRDWAEGLRAELKWLAAELGAVRDLEVLEERLAASASTLEGDDALGASALLGQLRTKRESARAGLLAALDSPRYLDLLDALVAAADRPQLTAAAKKPARRVMSRLVRKPWNALEADVDALGDAPADEALHQVRIAAKRARYAAEAATPACGRTAARFASGIADLQDVLGDLHDGAVASAWLRQAGASTTAEAMAAGQLIAAERTAMARDRAQWKAAWKRAAAGERRRWLRA